MKRIFDKEVGSVVNQATQRGIRNGWLASIGYIAAVLAWGGFYQPGLE